ncbi:MAG TPA: hypothetical protein VHV76_15800 [Mycobacteriales bacterium]|nr:hypothetical protein [Mycobacteriales bacterium]
MTHDPASGPPAPGAAAPDPAAAADPSAALTDVRNQLMRLGQQIAEMRTDPAVAGAETANGVIAELREAVRFLAERMDGVARMVAQRGEELADTRGALGAIDAHVRSQAETIAVLSTGMQALPSYGERVSALQDNLNVLQQRLGGIEGAFAPIGQRLGGIESAVARPDSGVSERLAAIEGMLGPLSQRLGQALTEQAASLQALHGRVESVASGTQAALATPVQLDDSAVAAIEPRLAALLSEISALRQEVSSLPAVAGAAAPSADFSAEFAALREQIASLPRPAAGDGTAPAAGLGGDVEAALADAERRINEHIDDAVLALAQTLLGKSRKQVTLPDGDDVEPVATGWPAEEPAAAAGAGGGFAEPTYDDSAFGGTAVPALDYADEGSDVAQIDFSKAQLEDDGADTVSWSAPAPTYEQADAQAEQDAAYLAQTGGSDLFDQEAAAWGAASARTPDQPTVVPERRRRWFSW